jgi:hypothetical protein
MALTQTQGEMVAGGSGALALPVGTTAQRPATPATGMWRFNSTTNGLEYYNGSSWVAI